ncbi:cell division protein FtsQ/DivIB [uncultured Hymenobacter sp.]|uniref:cell division protein FtsQ/DivIB n=1 Tax=uncultured Hymenobacter sp. TaxID=170016 RepID=UPI0035CA98D6
MNKTLRNVLFTALCLLVLGALGVFAALRQHQRPVDEVVVNVQDEFDNYFISGRGVTALLTKGGREPVVGTRPEGPRLRELEARLKAHPFVKDAQVYRDLAGNLHADVRQNRPIARLIHADARLDSYVDADGRALPLSPLYTARVATVARAGGGALPGAFFQDSTGRRYLEFLRYVDEHPFWRAQVAEVFVEPGGKLSFTQQIGDQRIEFGPPADISDKFAKLMVFYRQIPSVLGWDTYHRVNVEYQNQIICE